MTATRLIGRSIAACVASAIATTPAIAQQDHVGNALNPQVLAVPAARDPDGLGITEFPRTPTGRLHLPPRVVVDPRRSEGGWFYRVGVEIGALGTSGDTDNAKFREYKDFSSGLYVNTFGLSFEKPDSARHFSVYGGALGRGDQYFGGQAGTYNSWRVRGFYNDVPHVFTSTYRSLWSGVGAGALTTTLPPGGTIDAATTQAAIRAALAETPFTDLELTRHRGSARLDLTLPGSVNAFASYAREDRAGSRPFGMIFGGGGGGGNAEPPESIDATTTDVVTGVQFARGHTQVNAQGTVSLFSSGIDILAVGNPLFVSLNTIAGVPPTAFTDARFDLHPDNTYTNIRAEIAHRLPELAGSRVTGVISLSRYQQNDALTPWTSLSLAGGTINGVPTGNVWNQVASLTKAAADARIDTTLVDLGWSVKPATALDVRAKFRYFDTDNRTEFWACNPLTGQWGRLINDGSGGSFVTPNLTAGNNPPGTLSTGYDGTGCSHAATSALGLVPSAGNVVLRNVPFAHRQINIGATVSYRLNRHNNLEVAFERESFDREHRERDETWEHNTKVTYAMRGFDAGTLRVSYAYGRRRGTPYIADPYEEFLSASFGPTPTAPGTNVGSWFHAVEQLRKFDLADRDRHAADVRFNYAIVPSVDASLGVVFRDLSFPASSFGRTDHQRQLAPSVDITWQPTVETSVGGFASLQYGRMRQVGLQPNGCVLGNSYFFFSDGSMQTNATGIAPAPPAGASLVATEVVLASNWQTLCGEASATSPLFPLSRTWEANHRDRNTVAGVTAYHAVGSLTLNLGYTYGRSRTAIDYAYNPAALGMSDLSVALAGSGWPDLLFDQHFVDSDVTVPLKSWAGLHIIYRYEHGRIRDWHYDGVDANPMPANNAVYLDAGPRDYGAHVAGVFVRLDLR